MRNEYIIARPTFSVSSKFGLVFQCVQLFLKFYKTGTKVEENRSFIFLRFISGLAPWIIYFFNSNFKDFNGLAVVYYKVNTHTHKKVFWAVFNT